jgi:hypothetical protein
MSSGAWISHGSCELDPESGSRGLAYGRLRLWTDEGGSVDGGENRVSLRTKHEVESGLGGGYFLHTLVGRSQTLDTLQPDGILVPTS